MNKGKLLTLILLISTLATSAQYRLSYVGSSEGSTDTTKTEVFCVGNQIRIQSGSTPLAHPIPGIAKHFTYIDYANNSIITQLFYSDTEQYYCSDSIRNHYDFTEEGTEKINGFLCKKYSIVLFSNKIELWTTQDLKFRATMSSGFSQLPGVLVKYCRNGNYTVQLKKVAKDTKLGQIFPAQFGTQKSATELNQMEKEKLILRTVVFEEEQICFNPKIAKPQDTPYDSVLHFANGTLILKKIKMPKLPAHYQIFAEVTEQSNGDAYDRTGSIFVIPTSQSNSMLKALLDSVEVMPYFEDRNGGKYHGMLKTDNYLPPIELVRFFTPFGVGHYNQYRSIPGEEWAEKVSYKQDISDYRSVLSGDVYIGAFIGNYDGGGHKLSLTLKAYPESDEWTFDEKEEPFVLPLFNTCNVMEMAGQNYGRFFGTDSLTVTFTVPEGISRLRLRYTTTGHGGWDTGDEFVPKANTILIDGEQRFVYTPWRCDCGTYRASNPASGNFWNGLSSSDYSRSGWCPGTATQPTFFDLSDLKPGTHTITVAIPQGEPEGSSFSAWSVSGALIGTIQHP